MIGHGRPLEPGIRDAMERLFQADFSAVRVHEGSTASSIGALAFTVGDALHFAPGRYDPTSRAGVALLGHELTHVVQQREGRVANPFGHGVAIVQDPALEAEADRMGQWIAEALQPGRSIGKPVMRGAGLRADGRAHPREPVQMVPSRSTRGVQLMQLAQEVSDVVAPWVTERLTKPVTAVALLGGGAQGDVYELTMTGAPPLLVKVNKTEKLTSLLDEGAVWAVAGYAAAIMATQGLPIIVPPSCCLRRGRAAYTRLQARIADLQSERAKAMQELLAEQTYVLAMEKAQGVEGSKFIRSVIEKGQVTLEPRESKKPKIVFFEDFFRTLGAVVAIDFFLGNVDRLPIPSPTGRQGLYAMDTFNLDNILVFHDVSAPGEFTFYLIDNNMRSPRMNVQHLVRGLREEFTRVLDGLPDLLELGPLGLGDEILGRLMRNANVNEYVAPEIDDSSKLLTGNGFLTAITELFKPDHIEAAAKLAFASIPEPEKSTTRMIKLWVAGTTALAQIIQKK